MAACSLGPGFALTTVRIIADKSSTSSSSSSCNGSAIRIKSNGGSIIRAKLLYCPPFSSVPCFTLKNGSTVRKVRRVSCHSVSTNPPYTTQYEEACFNCYYDVEGTLFRSMDSKCGHSATNGSIGEVFSLANCIFARHNHDMKLDCRIIAILLYYDQNWILNSRSRVLHA